MFQRTFFHLLGILTIIIPIGSAKALQPSHVPGQFDANTLVGRFRNVVTYVAMPVVPPGARTLRGRGIYVVELVNGNVEDVRVLKSAGYKVLDDAAITALRQWRFKPHIIYKATIPIEFRGIRPASEPPDESGTPRRGAIFAPKPDYPYEARSKHWTGSGILLLDVDVSTGQVTEARMIKTTGHQILDDAALTAFRKWHFKPGKVAPQVRVPIRFTMQGATY